MKARIFDALRAALAERRAVALVTDLGSGLQTLVDAEGRQQGEAGLEDEFLPQVVEAIRQDRRGIVDFYDGRFFINVHPPANRLLIVGAVHLAQALVPAARLAGFDVSVIDPRTAFATPERFPDTDLITEWPDEALARLRPDARTAVVALTHDPKFDDPALIAALSSAAFYVGVLGGRKNQAARLDRLRTQGLTADQLARIHGPVGLDIGAVSPAEIAVAILADIILALRGPKWKAD
ncbi:MAG: XdhC family protein [Niveispirillum sp.]|uniref:XdhC family protein n=1 Tax=Niveispirillum sp. TaxID=1917217 RepID=UPI003BA690FB